MITKLPSFIFMLLMAAPVLAQQKDTVDVGHHVRLKELLVTSVSADQRVKVQQIGAEKINIGELYKMPALFGERDILRSLQLLPGIKSEGDGSAGYQVRGGTAAQNLVMLDGATIYNSGHMMGLFSAFNDEALSNATLYKGQIPAQYGGATSSVLDIATKNGNYDQWHYGATIGLLAVKLHGEGPISKKVSLMVTARRSYADMFMKMTKKYRDNTMNFYDINARVNYRPSDKDNLFFSLYNCRDNMGIADLMDMHWGNMALTGRWYHFASDKLTFATTMVYSYFNNDVSMDISNSNLDFGGHIRQAHIKEDVTWQVSKAHTLTMGLQCQWQQVKSADWWYNIYHELEQRQALNNDLWINEDWQISPQIQLSMGLRMDFYTVLDTKSSATMLNERTTYVTPEPRTSLKWCLNDVSSIKLGYSRMTQDIHALRNSSTSLPFDRYTISTTNIHPEVADQISIGYMRTFHHTMYDMSVETYYKAIDHVYDYMDGKTFTSNVSIENIILGGKGRAYGVELCLRKNLGNLTGWVSYTLSWSQNKIPGINGGEWYTASNDRRHDFHIVAMYQLKRGWNLSGTFLYTSGQSLSAPTAKYDIDGKTVFYYSERNGYRAPAYYRLDLSATNVKKFKKWERHWSFGVYNATNHYNPYIVSFVQDKTKPAGVKCKQTSLFGVIPFVSFTIQR